jgi:hypothetical protein
VELNEEGIIELNGVGVTIFLEKNEKYHKWSPDEN